MPPFAGFPDGKSRLTRIPAAFFTELLPEVDHLGELKVTLYAVWFLDRSDEPVRYLTYADFSSDERLLAGLCSQPEEAPAALADALKRAVQRGTLLRALPPDKTPEQALFFLNSPRGRAAVKALESGEWTPDLVTHPALMLSMERPNIYRLYEENIGPLTPLIAETLRDAERTYPVKWIEDAIRIAVRSNARRWNYIERILRSWQEEGRDAPNRRDSEKDRRKYIEGEYADYIEH